MSQKNTPCRSGATDLYRLNTGSITAQTVDEVALIRGTISQYSPVLIALFVNLTGGVTAQKFFSKRRRF